MEANGRQEAYQSLIFLAEKQGYVTFDNIMNCADDYSLPIQDFDWLSNAITARGILVYSENPSSQNTDETDEEEYDDFAQSDYEKVYSRIIEICPSLESFVTQVRNTLPPQYREISRLKYQVVDGNHYARNRMIEMHLRQALRIALNRAEAYDLDLEETIGDACVGLIYAVDKYDPDSSGPFASYAALWIMQNISRTQATQRPLMYFPVHRKEDYYATYPLAKNKGCIGCDKIDSCPYIREMVLGKLHCTDVEATYAISQMIPFISLQELLEFEEDEFENTHDDLDNYLRFLIADEDSTIINTISKAQLKESVERVLDSLGPKNAEIIRMRYGFYGDEMTLEEVGQRYNLTRERIRQIEAKVLRKMKGSKIKSIMVDYDY